MPLLSFQIPDGSSEREITLRKAREIIGKSYPVNPERYPSHITATADVPQSAMLEIREALIAIGAVPLD
ncbi:MAG: hypothetical protein WCV62_04375 [Candidatus Peribacteraceae bacterium]|jgi:hypothetical protein